LLGANPRRIPKMGQQQGTETKVFFCVGQVVVVAAAHDCILALLHHHVRIDVLHPLLILVAACHDTPETDRVI
jgi:hypothetical protein